MEGSRAKKIEAWLGSPDVRTSMADEAVVCVKQQVPAGMFPLIFNRP